MRMTKYAVASDRPNHRMRPAPTRPRQHLQSRDDGAEDIRTHRTRATTMPIVSRISTETAKPTMPRSSEVAAPTGRRALHAASPGAARPAARHDVRRLDPGATNTCHTAISRAIANNGASAGHGLRRGAGPGASAARRGPASSERRSAPRRPAPGAGLRLEVSAGMAADSVRRSVISTPGHRPRDSMPPFPGHVDPATRARSGLSAGHQQHPLTEPHGLADVVRDEHDVRPWRARSARARRAAGPG